MKDSNRYVIFFMTTLCFIAALILSLLSSILAPYQKKEVELYQARQLLIAAKILSYNGTFLETGKVATPAEIFKVQSKRVVPRLTDDKGQLFTFEELNINYETYLKDNSKYGYASLPYKLVYLIYTGSDVTGFVIPVNGYGLWDAIYGYLALKADGNTIIGATWYNQKETPGLGANIGEKEWQAHFDGKKIFQNSQDKKNSKLGIIVVKTTVKDELGASPLSHSAVDGIAGATVTRNGVQEAYKDSLGPYRNFLIRNSKH